MTFNEKIAGLLVNHGLWDDEAKVVIRMVKAEQPSMADRWDDDVSGYPDAIVVTLWMSAKRNAIEYLKAYHSNHFALCLLEPKEHEAVAKAEAAPK